MNIKISVITTFHNDQNTIAETINSIVQQLTTDIEYILVDDGSSDLSREIAKRYEAANVRIVGKNKIGRSCALNLGLQEAKGQYVAIIDADDVAYRNRLELQAAFLDRNPGITLCASNATFITYSGDVIKDTRFPSEHDQLLSLLLRAGVFVHSTVMFRKRFALNIGGYPEWCEKSIDFNFYLKLLRANAKLYLLQDSLTYYRDYDFSWGKRDHEAIQLRCAILGMVKYYVQCHLENEVRAPDACDNQSMSPVFLEWFLKKKYLDKITAKSKIRKAQQHIKQGRIFIAIREVIRSLCLDPMLFFYSGSGFRYPKHIIKFLKYASKRGYSSYVER